MGLRLCIVGAGAIGMSYAAQFAKAAGTDRQLLLATRRNDLCSRMSAGLTVVDTNSVESVVDVSCDTVNELLTESQDVVILAVKTFDNRSVLPSVARALAPNGACLSLQNGIDNQRTLDEFVGPSRAFQGATSLVATAIDPVTVQIASRGKTWMPTAMPYAQDVADWLSDAGMEAVLLEDLGELQWQKAAMATAGPVCVILDTPFGVVAQDPDLQRLMRAATTEVVDVARRKGVHIDKQRLIDEQNRIWAAAPPEAMSSLLADYRAGRTTELEDRFGVIIKIAAEAGANVPVYETLYTLVKHTLTGRSPRANPDEDGGAR